MNGGSARRSRLAMFLACMLISGCAGEPTDDSPIAPQPAEDVDSSALAPLEEGVSSGAPAVSPEAEATQDTADSTRQSTITPLETAPLEDGVPYGPPWWLAEPQLRNGRVWIAASTTAETLAEANRTVIQAGREALQRYYRQAGEDEAAIKNARFRTEAVDADLLPDGAWKGFVLISAPPTPSGER